MDVLLADGTRLEPWLFILLPLVLGVAMAVFGARWMRQNNRDWTRIGGGLARLRITGGWLLRREGLLAVREPMTFVPDPDHEHAPEALPEQD